MGPNEEGKAWCSAAKGSKLHRSLKPTRFLVHVPQKPSRRAQGRCLSAATLVMSWKELMDKRVLVLLPRLGGTESSSNIKENAIHPVLRTSLVNW
ncbi:hypothetical protein OPV22_020511 [Ensete ventricosum]|uniref:Uncharacterized protein n=1 Tax=Ensete ventricosum TaxID=4639 RepID=A0AAV8QPY8_ENSVE|nr:hypothetical protein OPV22_020511 [Ensete ventricosum]